MQFVVKFASIVAIALLFASCHNEVPGLPSPDEIAGYKYCKYKDKDGESPCKSPYEISEKDCVSVGGIFFSDVECKDPYPPETQ